MHAYLDGDVLFVDRETGPLTVLTDTDVAECFQLPTGADELVHPIDAAEWAWGQIDKLTLTKKARREIRAALGLNEEE